jgi:hypothetical protein
MSGKPGSRERLAAEQSKGHLRSRLRHVTENALRRLTEQHGRLTRRLQAEEARPHPRMTFVLKLETQLRLLDQNLIDWGLSFGLPKPTSERVLDPAEEALQVAYREQIRPMTATEWDTRFGAKSGEPDPPPANPELAAKLREIAGPAKPKPPVDPMKRLDQWLTERMEGKPLN